MRISDWSSDVCSSDLVERATRPDADFRYRIFNSDGSEVEHCGNGARCFVRFVHEQGLSDRNPLRAEIATGILVLDEGDDEQVTVDKIGRASCRERVCKSV